MPTLCREAYEIGADPPYFIEWGDDIEKWDEVQARAISVQRLQNVNRDPWIAVYRVQLQDAAKFYLVAK